MRRILAPAACLAVAVAFALALPASAQTATTIVVDASTTYAALLQEIAAAYHEQHPDIAITVANLGSRAGATAVEGRSADVAFVDSAPSSSAVTATPVFAIPLAIVLSPQLQITTLTRVQIAGLFAGGYSTWKQLNGPDIPVKVFTRPPQSAMSAAFVTTFGGTPSAGEAVATSSEATNAVRATPGAIAFVTLDAARAANLTPISIDGRDPASGLGTTAYPFYAYGYAVTSGPPSRDLSRFLAFVETRRALLAKYGVVSTRDLRR